LVSLIPEEVGRGNNVFIRDFPVAENVDYHCEVPLYDYQQKAVEEVYWKQYGILQSPAGSGKTQMGIALVAKLGKRALWLTHTKDLLTQSKQRAEQYMDPGLMGTITEGKVNIGSGITFATVQTMCNLDLSQYKDYWDVIIVDECHRVAGTPTAVSQFSKVLNSLAARHKYGLSATVHRSDGLIQSTFALLGDVIYTVPTEAVADKIMKVGICPVPTGIGISRGCLNPDGTLNYAKLISYLTESDGRNRLIVENIVGNRDNPSLVLSDRLGHLETLMAMLPADMQEYAVMVSGKMTTKKSKAEREQAIADMRSGAKKYLFATYSLCKEGLDIPRLERLYMATPQKDYAVITQAVGRIARTSKEKEDPVVYDFVDDIQYLVKAYKKRCTTYRKNGCYFVER
jgi:superfamily II DNA or RNA helicase